LDNQKHCGYKQNELMSQIVEAQIARFRGDPKPSKATFLYVRKLMLSRSLLDKKIGLFLKSIWEHKAPDDNSLKIDLD
jgi:hypothetical protein